MFFTPVMRRAAFVPNPRGVDAQLERWLGEALQQPRAASASKPSSPATVAQDDKAYTLSFDVPGVSKAQLSIGIEGKVVRIESLADAPRAYKLAYELPQDIDVSSSEAKLDNGVLTLKLGKLVPPSTQLKID
jgi:HSP20 family molecular chaperone IbpA